MKNHQPGHTRHKFHGIIAAIPAFLLILSFILDLFNLPTTTKEPSIRLANVIFYMILIGLIGMIIVSIPGLADYSPLKRNQPIKNTAQQHLAFSILAFIAFAGSLVSRWEWSSKIGPPLVPIGLSVFGTGFIGYAGYMGMRLMRQLDIARGDEVNAVENLPPVPQAAIPGTAAQGQWKQAEQDAQRWRVEPRVDADGDTI